jgi:AraC-like DNA-binding protein
MPGHLPAASFDSWTIVFLNFSFLGLLIALFFLFRRSAQRKANRIMAVYTLLFSICMVEYVLYWTRYLFYYPFMADISGGFPLLWGPLLYFYFKVVYEDYRFAAKDLLHLLPFALYVGYKMPYYVAEGAAKFQPLQAIPFYKGHGLLWLLMPWLRIGHKTIYAVAMLVYLRKQSSLGDSRKWSLSLFVFYVLFILTGVAYYWLVNYSWFNNDWDYFISFVMSASIISTAWFAFSSPAIFNGYRMKESLLEIRNNTAVYKYVVPLDVNKEEEKTVTYSYRSSPAYVQAEKKTDPQQEEEQAFVKYRNSGLTDAASEEMAKKIGELMQKERLYRANDLSLDKLADRLGYLKHHVSQVINERFGMNFFEYINHLRIEEAKELLRTTDAKTMNVIQVAYTVGFNNKVTFNTAFKRHTGQTPTAYRNADIS